jgi:hypothetical protein
VGMRRRRALGEEDAGSSARPVAKKTLVHAHTNILLINNLASRGTKPLFSKLSLLEVLLATICGQAKAVAHEAIISCSRQCVFQAAPVPK